LELLAPKQKDISPVLTKQIALFHVIPLSEEKTIEPILPPTATKLSIKPIEEKSPKYPFCNSEFPPLSDENNIFNDSP